MADWRESDADMETEQHVADKCCSVWSCMAERSYKGGPYDYRLLRDGILVALLEVRRRNVNSDTYADLFMSERKHRQLLGLASSYGVPMVFVVSFDDGDRWIDLTLHPRLGTSFASRGTNPAGGARATDRELCVLIPVAKMRPL